MQRIELGKNYSQKSDVILDWLIDWKKGWKKEGTIWKNNREPYFEKKEFKIFELIKNA